MKITGLKQVKKSNRSRVGKRNETSPKNSAKKNSNRNSRRSSNGNKGVSFYTKNKKEVNLFILSTIFLSFSIFVYWNWNRIVSTFESVDFENRVAEAVISSNKDDDDGIERTILLLTDLDDSNEIIVKKVYSLSINKEKGIRSIAYIPGEVYVTLSYNDIAEYSSIRNLHYAGEVIGTDLGPTYTIYEISHLLGQKYDNYIWLGPGVTREQERINGLEKEADGFKYFEKITTITNPFVLLRNSQNLLDSSDQIYTDLDAGGIFSVLSEFSGDLDSGVSKLDMSEAELSKPFLIPSGEEVRMVNRRSLDDRLKQLSSEILSKDIERELASVEIYNGSTIGGLASGYGRDISNNGIKVVRVDNTDRGYPETTIYLPDLEAFQNTLQLIESLLPKPPKIVTDRPEFLTTGDIVIVLGQDIETSIEWLPN